MIVNLAELKYIAERISAVGGKTYVVGGAVRDSFIGVQSKDVDLLVTGVELEKVRSALPEAHVPVGKSFSTLKVPWKFGEIDIALPRVEAKRADGTRDVDNVTIHPNLSVEEDLSRRDFTMNAIAIDVLSGDVIDPFEGRVDIEYKQIVFVGEPQERIFEDPVRMMRAMRFVAKTGFALDPLAAIGIKFGAELLRHVAAERIQKELMGLLSATDGQWVRNALNLTMNLGLFEQFIPELERSAGFAQNNPYHDKNVWDHVTAAVAYAVQRGFSPRARLAILLHDISKPETYSTDENGHGHFYRHEEVGSVKVREVLSNLRFSADMISDVSKIVEEHLRPQNNNDRTLRRFAAEMGDLTDDALACREADLFAHAGHISTTARAVVDDFRARIATLPVKGFTVADVALRGDVIREKFPGVNGRDIGVMKNICLKAVIDGEVENTEEALINFLRKRGS